MTDTRLSALGRFAIVLSVAMIIAAMLMAAIGPVVMFGGVP